MTVEYANTMGLNVLDLASYLWRKSIIGEPITVNGKIETRDQHPDIWPLHTFFLHSTYFNLWWKKKNISSTHRGIVHHLRDNEFPISLSTFLQLIMTWILSVCPHMVSHIIPNKLNMLLPTISQLLSRLSCRFTPDTDNLTRRASVLQLLEEILFGYLFNGKM